MNNYTNEIPIVMATDYNYLFPTAVTIWSVLKNGNKNTGYCFYFLVKAELAGMDNGLFDKIREAYPNFSYQYAAVDGKPFEKVTLTNQHVTIETYYRLVICELFPSWDKCLYLDGDLIVQCDIAELYQLDMKENCLAAVKDVGMQCGRGAYFIRHKKELGFKNMETYFNAGVLVFNLKKIRDDSMTAQFLKAIDCNYSLEDQDILNVTCKGKVLNLPLKYNVFSGFFGKTELYSCGTFPLEELGEIKEDYIKIVHYAGEVEKPWKNRYSKKAGLWWLYAWEMPVVKWAEEKRRELSEPVKESDWLRIAEKCKQYDMVFLYGFTQAAKGLLYKLKSGGVGNIRFFLDRDSKKIGQTYENIICTEPSEWLAFLQKNYLIVNCAQKACKEVRNLLCALGVPESSIVDYVVKNREYYRILDEQYYNREMEQEVLCDISLKTDYPVLFQKSCAEQKKILESPENYFLYKDLYDKYFLFDWYVNKPLVSIIIPAYNAEKYIDRCLGSISEQTYPNWECIIINDGSVDQTEERIKEWIRMERRFRLVSQGNAGMGQARNRGICLAKGRYLTFVDADDWVEPSYVEDMLMAVLRNNADICKSNFWYHDMENDKISEAGIEEAVNPYSFEVYRTPNMWCNLFRRELFEDNQIKMPGIPLEDLAVYPLLLLKAKGIVGVPKPLYHYQINTGNSVMDNMKNIMYYPEAISFLLTECERLNLRDTYEDLLRDIAFRHMNGSLNSRVKKWLPEKEFEEYRLKWYQFLENCFPGCLAHYGVKAEH